MEVVSKKLLDKKIWATARGATEKPRRLKLTASTNGLFSCPLENCDCESFKSIRGCRKHVCQKHGWYFYFNHKPNPIDVLPKSLFTVKKHLKQTRSYTATMECFDINCPLSLRFVRWITSVGGGSKSKVQANLIVRKILKFLKFACPDAAINWSITDVVVDFCLGNVKMISEFIDYLQDTWKVGFSGVIGYLNALAHLIDFRKSDSLSNLNIEMQIATEVFIVRAKKSLTKCMKRQWHELLNVDYLNKINCWATLEELKAVIPFHSQKFKQIVINSKKHVTIIPSQDLTFSTAFIVVALFLLVKASRPMTFQYLTVGMFESIKDNGIIDQTAFKTQSTYGFDSLVFSKEVLVLVQNYIKSIRPRFNPSCSYVLVNRNGLQLSKLSDIFGRLVYQAIGKYIHPTRYRQIVETESSSRLDIEDQIIISEDQKHSSNVAKVFYKKNRSQDVAAKGRKCMDKLVDTNNTLNVINDINSNANLKTPEKVDFVQTKSKTIDTTNVQKEAVITRKRRKKTPFSSVEDEFLSKGIKRYGVGKWSSILNDPEYVFDESRVAATIQIRAKLKGYV